MNLSFKPFLKILFFLLDLLLLNISFFIAKAFFEESPQSAQYLRYTQFWMIINGFWVLLSWMGEVYKIKNISFFDSFLRVTFKSYGLWVGMTILYLLLPRLINLSSAMVITTVVLFPIGLMINRILYLAIKQWVKIRFDNTRKVLILGYNNTAKKFTSYIESEGFGFEILGYIDDKNNSKEYSKYPIYNGISEALATAKRLRANEIFSTIMPENNSKVYSLMRQADKDLIRFRLVADLQQLVDHPVHIDLLHDLPLLSTRREPLEEVINIVLKRTFDVGISVFVAVFFLSWMVPVLGLLIKLESPGPIFFVQLRSGKNNRPFRCFKFRSMGVNNKAESTQATKGDIRVTKIGRILRKTSLDEFPQFLNVLMGQMSIVGPRPHMLKHTKDFANLADDYMIRQFLKPGITGWAQVNGFRGEIRELMHIKKRVEHDLWYLENWSVWLDIRIIFLTVYNAVKGEENAY